MRTINQQYQEVLDQIFVLGRQHYVAIKESVTLTNMLKARVREILPRDKVLSGEGEHYDKKAITAAYKHYLDDGADPFFTESVAHLLSSREISHKRQKRLATEMGKLVMQLPVWQWAQNQRGCGAPILAKVFAEAGRDLSEYDTPAKLWKRFGLAVTNGKAPRREKGVQLDFSSYRRSVAYQLGECLIRAGGNAEEGTLTYWKRLYLRRKEYEIEQAALHGITVVPAAKIPSRNKDAFMSEGHVHARAKRRMEKAFLKALWEEWTEDVDAKLPAFLEAAE